MSREQSFYEREIHPIKQSSFFLILTIGLLSVIKVFNLSGSVADGSTVYWEISLMIVLIFGIFNSVMGLPFKNQNDYWFYSTIGYLAIAIAGAILSYFYCGKTLDELGPFKSIYFVFTFGYLVFLSMIRAMRKIVEIAQREDKRMAGNDE